MKNIHLDKQAKKWDKPQVKTVSSQELKRVMSLLNIFCKTSKSVV